MLVYHPLLDVNHCTYRLCAILSSISAEEISIDQLRILDYYYLFPSEIKNITPWPASLKGNIKKLVKNITDCFEDIGNPSRVFFDLFHFQKNAILELVSKGIIEPSVFETGQVKLSSQAFPYELASLIKNDPFVNSDTFKIISCELPKLEMNGPNGLKKRSGLMEFRYDPS